MCACVDRVPPLPKLEDLVKKSQDLSVELEKNNLTLTRLKEEVGITYSGLPNMSQGRIRDHLLWLT